MKKRSLFLLTTLAGAAAAGALLAACSLGPDYVRPAAPLPAAYKELDQGQASGWVTARPADAAPRGAWWLAFNDPALDALEDRLNASNQTVAAAIANVRAAKAVLQQAQAQFFPTVGTVPSVTRAQTSTALFPGSRDITTYELPVEASWEPDLWGRVGKTAKADFFGLQMSMADLENVRLSAQAQLAAVYYQLRAQDEQRRLLEATVRAYRTSLALTKDQEKGGAGTDEAVTLAETQLRAAEAQATNLGVLRAQYEHAIAVLCGEPPAALSIPAGVSKPALPAIPLDLPSTLLERRPDIASAERAMAKANAEIGVAKTAFFPTLTLGASAGFQAFSMANFLALPSLVWAVGPALAQSLFDGGARKAALHQAKAGYDQTVANYRQTVLTSFQQVEDNLSNLRILSQALAQQDKATAAARVNLSEADARYKAGLDPYLNVIAAQTALLANQQVAVNFHMQLMVSSVRLIQALGGGWSATALSAGPEDAGKAALPPRRDHQGG